MTTEHESQYPTADYWAPNRPDWSEWKNTRETALWKAVVLACDLDPVNFQLPGSDCLACHWKALPQQAEDLLAAAKGAIGAGGMLLVENRGAANFEEAMVDLLNFTTWIQSTSHRLPDGFPWAPKVQDFINLNWPWGRHSTTLLRRLAEVGVAKWKNYDPTDPTTAPTNEDVIKWLVDHDVSANLAKAMATILRADGLKTGPRK